MDLIRDINTAATEKQIAVEVAAEEVEQKPDTGKSVADYLSNIQQEETK